jgi:hypothetical protein
MAHKSDKPHVIGIILCERILQDVIRRDAISCINIHNGITAQAFPALVPLVYVFAQLSGSHHEFTYQFRIVDRLHNIIAASTKAKVEPLPNKFMTHKIISAFTGLAFPEEGTYHIVLSIDGEDAGDLPFQVVHALPEMTTA